ncbi:DUF5320 domain-containing protein [Candidatus Aerophobetes bacterium]|nr:DUF5320 domain-containing protein [Candidatus Aerophobetes bacterium]
MCGGYIHSGCCVGGYPHPHFYQYVHPMGHPFWGCCHPVSKEEEIEYLRNMKDVLEKKLEAVKNRIEEIEKE